VEARLENVVRGLVLTTTQELLGGSSVEDPEETLERYI
jgi:hypothetical protein